MMLNYLNDTIFRLNMALDSGRSAPLEAAHKHIADGDVFEWLSSEFGCDFSILLSSNMAEEKAAISNALRNWSAARSGSEGRKLGVEKNGLCLLIGLVLEIISTDKISIDSYENFLREGRVRH